MPPPKIDTSSRGEESEIKAPESPTSLKNHHHPHRIFKVYVTGFGTFEKIPINASHLVASSLPSVLEEKYIHNAPPSQHLQVSIIPHFEAVPVSYDKVEKLIPTLYKGLPGVDLFVHIGVAPFEEYRIETKGRRGPYGPPDGKPDGRKDVEKKWPDGHAADRAAGGKVPVEVREIVTGLDVKEICERLEAARKESQDDFGVPKPSVDAGLYLCEFIFYNSMAESIYNDEAPYETEYPESKLITNPKPNPPTTSRAIFIHIPHNMEDEWLERSKETVKRIIGAIAVQRITP